MKTPSFKNLLATAIVFALPSALLAVDSDGDGLDDSVETNTGVYVSPADTGTNPDKADTDGDGVPDGLEVKEKTSPVDDTSFNSFSKGMVAYYPFSGNAKDESGHNHHGTVLGNTTPALDRFGRTMAAYRFDGNTYGTNNILSTIRVDDQFLRIGDDYTISGWFNSENVSQSYQCLFNTLRHVGIAISLNDPNAPGYLAYGIGPNFGGWTVLYLHGNKNNYQNNIWHQFALTKAA